MELKSNIGRADEETTFAGTCTNMNETPDEKYWTNRRDLSSVVMNWEAGYDKPNDLPHVPNYIRHDQQGIIETYAEISLFNAGNVLNVLNEIPVTKCSVGGEFWWKS